MAKLATLLDKVKTLPPARGWLERLTPKQQKELLELREQWHAGQIEAGPTAVHAAFIEHIKGNPLDPVVSETHFRRFLGKKPKVS